VFAYVGHVPRKTRNRGLYVCIHACKCTFVYIDTNLHRCMYVYVCVCVCRARAPQKSCPRFLYMFMYTIYLFIYICMYICIRVYICVYRYINTY